MASSDEVTVVSVSLDEVLAGTELDRAGLVILGEFLGGKDPEPWERDGRSGTTRARLGVKAADGTEFSVACSEDTLRRFRRDFAKGQTVGVVASVRGPFGSSGPVKFFVRGEESGGGAGGWG